MGEPNRKAVDSLVTRASMIDRVRTNHPARRELAWDEFRRVYEPIITGFAKKMGAKRTDCDDLVQDVLLGFFSASEKFTYDPAKGRFRGYLKACVRSALIKRLGQQARFGRVPLESIDQDDAAVDHVWTDVWENEQLREAIEQLRIEHADSVTFRAFERYALKQQDAMQVAKDLGVSLNSVHQAKRRMSLALKGKVEQLREECG